ncbi:MAG: hypothetical protein EP319_12690 [Deltaproteobacteria bacterium]|nr:MAG: hypothetical protein EP319_12690 [Deltaproteobacteria bacterium]
MEFDKDLNQLSFDEEKTESLSLIPLCDVDREIELFVGDKFFLAPGVSLTLGDVEGNCLLEATREALEDNTLFVDNLIIGEVFHLGPENILEINGLKYKIAPRETPVIVEDGFRGEDVLIEDEEILEAEFSEFEQQELDLDLEVDGLFDKTHENDPEEVKLTEDHFDELDLGVDSSNEFEEWEAENLLEDNAVEGDKGKRLRIYFFSFGLVMLFGFLSWFNFSKLENKYLTNLSFISDGLRGKSDQQIDQLKSDYAKLKKIFEQRLNQAMNEIDQLSKNNTLKKSKRRSIPKKKVAKIQPVMKKAELQKPLILLSESDKEAILKEVEILKLESRLDPFSAREDLINLKTDLNDKDLIKVIDNVLRQI